MFGYFVLDKKAPDRLRKLYKKNYCYLCRSLGHHYGLSSRFMLSYDVSLFLILVTKFEYLNNVGEIKCTNKNGRLTYNYEHSEAIAALNLLLVCAKCDDDIIDEKSKKAKLLKFFLGRKFKKAKKLNPLMWDIIKNGYEGVRVLENNNSKLEDLENAFSNMMVRIAKECFNLEDPFKLNSLKLLSKWLYFIDAVDDLDKDIRYKRFNPLKMIADSNYDLKNRKYLFIANHIKELYEGIELNNFDYNDLNSLLVRRMVSLGVYEMNFKILSKKRR